MKNKKNIEQPILTLIATDKGDASVGICEADFVLTTGILESNLDEQDIWGYKYDYKRFIEQTFADGKVHVETKTEREKLNKIEEERGKHGKR